MKLNSLQLKIIAVVAMIIDHIAHYLLPVSHELYLPMRIVGRIAAPIFWFCFAVGLKHTSNKQKYLSRLGASAVIMGLGNICVNVIFNIETYSFAYPNIFLTMFLSGLALWCIERILKDKDLVKITALSFITLAISLAIHFLADYGLMALACILCFYYVKNKNLKIIGYLLISLIFCYIRNNFIQSAMVFIIPFLLFYTPEKPKNNLKWFFYVFYPAHVWLLMFISTLI